MDSYIIKEFLALNPKVYSIIHEKFDKKTHEVLREYNSRKAKGVSKPVVKKELTRDDYHNVLQTGESVQKDVTSIRSFNHQVYTFVQPKTALTSYYDKMYVMADGVSCSPYGYYNNKK
jgi:hypothetical protein